MKKTIGNIIRFIIVFLCGNSFYLFGQTSKQEIFAIPQKTGGVYYAYPSSEIITQTPIPAGYSPFYISHFGRHGSRYLIHDHDYKWVLDLFTDAQDKNALTALGTDVYKRLQKVWVEAEGHGGDLSPLGVRQQRGIAERMYSLYPEVFADSISISARSTTVVRCVLSMDALCERLKEFNPTLQITRDASVKYMSYLNYHTQEAIDYRSAKDTWKEEYLKFEENHTHPKRLINSLFSDSTYILKKVNPRSLMVGLFDIAGGMQNMEAAISFYDIFEKQELFDLWQCRNYRLYVEYANSSQNGGIMMANAKPLLQNILDSAKETIESKGRGVTLRFGHDGNIIPLAALMHLDGCYASISDPTEFYKVWSDFKVAPMAGNMQMIFFRNDNSNDILVKFLLNEKEILVPSIKSDKLPYYNWVDVEKFYKSLLKG